MRKKKTATKTAFGDRVIYMGPRLHQFGLGYGNVFINGTHPRVQQAIELCPAIAGLLVPIKETAAVRQELNFDYAHNMKGTSGKHVDFYRAIQNWLNSQSRTKQQQTQTTELHHA